MFADVNDSGVVLRGPGGVDRFFTRNVNGTLTAAAGDSGRLTDSAGLFTLTEADGTVWQFRADGRLDFVADTNGNRVTLGYLGQGLVGSLTHSNGRQLLLDYDGSGPQTRLVRVTDTAGPGTADDLVTTFAYSADRQYLTRATAPGGRVTEYDYAPLDLVTWKPTGPRGGTNQPRLFAGPRSHALRSVTHPDGSHDFFQYDAGGRLTETWRNDGDERVTFGHEPLGGNPGRVLVTDASGRQTTLYFGLGGQLAQVRDGDGRIVRFGYDGRSQFAGLTGPGGERYRYSYDANGNLTNVRDALNLETSFAYEPTHQRLASFTDARGTASATGTTPAATSRRSPTPTTPPSCSPTTRAGTSSPPRTAAGR